MTPLETFLANTTLRLNAQRRRRRFSNLLATLLLLTIAVLLWSLLT